MGTCAVACLGNDVRQIQQINAPKKTYRCHYTRFSVEYREIKSFCLILKSYVSKSVRLYEIIIFMK